MNELSRHVRTDINTEWPLWKNRRIKMLFKKDKNLVYETEIKKKHKTKKHQYIDDIGHISVHVRNVMAKKNPENIN